MHGRFGEPCPTPCGDTLERVSFESYEMAYCPTCQTGGKVLADRRLSRCSNSGPQPRRLVRPLVELPHHGDDLAEDRHLVGASKTIGS